MKAKFKKVLSHQEGALSHLMQNAHMFNALLELAHESLPQELSEHVVGVFWQERNLILQIDQAVWATQLRFYEPTILKVFQENMPHLQLQRTLVKIVPKPLDPEKRKLQMSKLSKENALQMRELSEHIESPELADALKRLSQFQKSN